MEEKDMRPGRIRFTIRGLMIFVCFLAFTAWVTEEWRRYCLLQPMFPRSYYVGDLIVNPGTQTSPPGRLIANPNTSDLKAFADRIKSSIMPYSWEGDNLFAVVRGTKVSATATPFPPTYSIIVKHTPEGHEQLAAWLRRERQKRLSPVRKAALTIQ